MNKRNIITFLIFLMTTSLGVIKVYGQAEAGQSISTTVQPAVAVYNVTQSEIHGTVNPETGVNSGLQAVYDIKTNGTDSNYAFYITSSIMVDGGEESAYGVANGENHSLLFAHTTQPPTLADVNNAKQGGNNNKNVFAYPINPSITDPMSIIFQNSYNNYKDGYLINLNGGTEGTVNYALGASPVSGTYNVGQDQCGKYQVIITISTIAK